MYVDVYSADGALLHQSAEFGTEEELEACVEALRRIYNDDEQIVVQR